MMPFNLRRVSQVPTAVFADGEPGEKIAATRDGHVFPARSTEDAAKLAEIIERAWNAHDPLVAALEEMISVYWGDGDGELPEPQCIQNARAAIVLAKGGAA